MASYGQLLLWSCSILQVLILIVMEDGLVQYMRGLRILILQSLNPYCSGRWSRTVPEYTLKGIIELS